MNAEMPYQSPADLPTSATPHLFWWMVAGSILLAMLPTIWPSLDLVAAQLFAGPDSLISAVSWFWVEAINLYVPAVFRLFLLVALLGWIATRFGKLGKRWRLALAFVVLAGVFGPGIVVNYGFKDNWQRARPYQVQELGGTQQFTRAGVFTDQCDNNCSFVSGHVACGFFFASMMLVHRRRKIAWGMAGVSAGLVIGFARMADSAHWLSDVLWACPITLMSSWIVWRILIRVYPDRLNTSMP
jgi:lipid A 4'-phosphatase